MTPGQAETTSGKRRSSRLAARLAVALATLAVTVAPALASPSPGGRILSPGRGQVLAAGDLVDVRWTELAGDVAEFELLLSLDDGRSFGLRLTVMLDPALASYSWQVPNLPADAARLRLRVGRRGREVEAEMGEAFRIVAARSAAVARPMFHDGELWLTPDAALWLHGLDPGRTRATVPVLPAWVEELASEGPSEDVGVVGSGHHRTDLAAGREVPVPRPAPRATLAAVDLPQRE